MPQSETIENKQRLPLIQCIAWGSGGMADNFLAWTIAYLAIPIYNIALDVDPVIIGWAIAIPRILDGFLNLFAGHWSDNFRSRWGRRRPFILVAGGIAVLFFVAAWFPPVHSGKTLITLYFVVTTFLYLGVYGFFSIPYYALGVELTTDYNERTRVQAWRFFFTAISQIVLPWFYKAAIRIGMAWPSGDIKPELIGVRFVGGLVGVITLLILILITVYCRESTHIKSQPKMTLLNAMGDTFKNRVFVRMAAVNLITLFGILVVGPLSLYVGIYYVCKGNKDFAATLGGLSGMVVGIIGILALTPLTALSQRFGKKPIFIAGQCLALIGGLLTWVLIRPDHPYWSILPWFLIAPGQLTVWLIGSSIGADIIDLDEEETGLRREGIYVAVSAMINKCGIGLSSLASGYLIVASGFSNMTLPSPDVIFRMRLFYALVPAAFILIAILISATLPISVARMHHVRQTLDRRRAMAAHVLPATENSIVV